MGKKPVSDEHAAETRAAFRAMIGPLRRVARQHGYALTVHGTLRRDIDLVAIPWTEDASPAPMLAEAIRSEAQRTSPTGFAGMMAPETTRYFRDGCPKAKPHGRLCWSFHLGRGPYIDLSVMPREANAFGQV